jgi:hypothetical protein
MITEKRRHEFVVSKFSSYEQESASVERIIGDVVEVAAFD